MFHIDSIDKKFYADENNPPDNTDLSAGSTLSDWERALEKTGTSLDRLPLNNVPSRSVMLNPSRPPTKVSPVEVVGGGVGVETALDTVVVTVEGFCFLSSVVASADILVGGDIVVVAGCDVKPSDDPR